MKDPFFESCLKPQSTFHPEIYERWLDVLQLSHCLIEFNSNIEKDRFKTERFFSRKTISSEKKNPEIINRERKSTDFLVFFCTTPEITKWACQDQRIDALQFNHLNIHKLVDDSTINLLNQNQKSIDINTMELTQKKSIRSLRNIKKAVYRAVSKEVPLLLSSYANSPDSLRPKKSIIGFSQFIGMKNSYYLNISQKWLFSRLIRNRKRNMNPEFIAPNIWVVSGGEE